jgi:hypothetical protein
MNNNALDMSQFPKDYQKDSYNKNTFDGKEIKIIKTH